ncbi:hypothetical protein AB3S75_018843 [Citrus x aurantiifolia]
MNIALKAKSRLQCKIPVHERAAEQSCLALLQSCNSLPKLAKIHSRILKLGLLNNPLVLTKFTATSSDLNAIDYATSVIFSPESDTLLCDTFLFNTIIRAYARTNNLKTNSIGCYNLMLEYGVSPNKFTYPFVLKACAGIGDLNLGKSVHGAVLKFQFGDDIHVQNTLVHMYGSCEGGVELGRKVFDEMSGRDSVSWSAMIGGYARLGLSTDAIDLFRQMQISGVCPDEITMVTVLSACTDLGALEVGKWVESFIEKQMVNRSVELCNALIDMFAKCGDVDKALKLFRSMNGRTIVSWTSVIAGLAMHGRGLEAVALFEELLEAGVPPDDVAFVGLLSACSHCGSGRVKEAHEFIQKMPIEANPIIWRTLISACCARGELKLAESITKWLIGNEPMHESNYVLLSHIYAKLLRWEKKTKIREVMDKRGMKKIPGSTLIELDNEIYEFVSGDKSHHQSKEIYEMLDEMGRKMKKAGYVPTTSEVLLDINEEDKEDALNKHSEKLAIAFALLKTPPGTPIRIVKNLRVCNACHSATKFISKIYNREIVVRDRHRFHHFKDGSCSCRDFW